MKGGDSHRPSVIAAAGGLQTPALIVASTLANDHFPQKKSIEERLHQLEQMEQLLKVGNCLEMRKQQ